MARICQLSTMKRCASGLHFLGSTGWPQKFSLTNIAPPASSNLALSFNLPSVLHESPISRKEFTSLDQFSSLSISSGTPSRQLCLLPVTSDRNIRNFLLYDKVYHLPIYNQLIPLDKLQPSRNISPQTLIVPSAVNNGALIDPPTVDNSCVDPLITVRKEAKKMSVLRIRHKKMKKHKLSKLRKRMRFIMRKKRLAKDRRKEKALVDFEMEQAKWARDFDAEKMIDAHLEKAREAGWGIDILAERSKMSSGSKS